MFSIDWPNLDDALTTVAPWAAGWFDNEDSPTIPEFIDDVSDPLGADNTLIDGLITAIVPIMMVMDIFDE